MDLMESIQLAFGALKANKMRALLTMLGIIIGIGSVIGIVTVGDSMRNSIMSSMQDLGASNIQVGLQMKASNSTISIDRSDLITQEMIEEFSEKFEDQIDAISLQEGAGNGQARDGRFYANVSVNGINGDYFKSNNLSIIKGRKIMQKDIDGVKNVAVVSDKLVKNIFGNEDPLGKEIKIYQNDAVRTFTVVGVYKYETNAMMNMMYSAASDKDISTNLYIPVTTAQRLNDQKPGYTYFMVTGKNNVDSLQLSSDIEKFFNRYYEKNEKFRIMAMSMESMLSQVDTMMGTLSIAIAVIAGISLLVGGIGVMNIMLVSVTERTREIGTRKALGAPNRAILMQFIIESIITCLIGGVLGIIVGILMGAAGASLLGFPAKPSFGIIVIAVTFSMAIGVFFGYYPANKAAKLNPIDALRYE